MPGLSLMSVKTKRFDGPSPHSDDASSSSSSSSSSSITNSSQEETPSLIGSKAMTLEQLAGVGWDGNTSNAAKAAKAAALQAHHRQQHRYHEQKSASAADKRSYIHSKSSDHHDKNTAPQTQKQTKRRSSVDVLTSLIRDDDMHDIPRAVSACSIPFPIETDEPIPITVKLKAGNSKHHPQPQQQSSGVSSKKPSNHHRDQLHRLHYSTNSSRSNHHKPSSNSPPLSPSSNHHPSSKKVAGRIWQQHQTRWQAAPSLLDRSERLAHSLSHLDEMAELQSEMNMLDANIGQEHAAAAETGGQPLVNQGKHTTNGSSRKKSDYD